MAVSNYSENEKILWMVYVNIRSKIDHSIREQKRIYDLESKDAALNEEKKLFRTLTEKVARREALGHSWQTILDKWELKNRNTQESGLNPITVIDTISMLRKWTQVWLKRPASQLTRGDARDVFNEAKRLEKSRSFQNKLKSAIKNVFEWGIEERLIRNTHVSPVEGLLIQKPSEEKLPEILNIEQIRELLVEAKNLDHPWYPVWSVALLTGMRSGELHELRWSDVDLENQKILLSRAYDSRSRQVKSTKARYWRTIPISGELNSLLVELKGKAQNKDEQVLPRFSYWDKGQQAHVLRTFCASAGLPSVKFHTLRACFATQLLANDIAPARVMKICGWKDLKTMQRYIRMAGIDERGATECLKVLASDAGAMAEVVNFHEFRARKKPLVPLSSD